MTLALNTADLITLGLAFATLLAGLVKYIAWQQDKRLDEKFTSLTEAIVGLRGELTKEAEATRQLETAFLRFQAELPRDYVRRDDFIRSIGVIEARIDNFALRMERALSTTIRGEA